MLFIFGSLPTPAPSPLALVKSKTNFNQSIKKMPLQFQTLLTSLGYE
jgi:hypothetical protein